MSWNNNANGRLEVMGLSTSVTCAVTWAKQQGARTSVGISFKGKH